MHVCSTTKINKVSMLNGIVAKLSWIGYPSFQVSIFLLYEFLEFTFETLHGYSENLSYTRSNSFVHKILWSWIFLDGINSSTEQYVNLNCSAKLEIETTYSNTLSALLQGSNNSNGFVRHIYSTFCFYLVCSLKEDHKLWIFHNYRM